MPTIFHLLLLCVLAAPTVMTERFIMSSQLFKLSLSLQIVSCLCDFEK